MPPKLRLQKSSKVMYIKQFFHKIMRKWVLITNQKLGMFALLEISVKISIDSRNLSVIWRCLTCEQKWNWYVYILCSYQPLTPLFFCQLKWKPSSNLWRPQSDLTLKIIPVVFNFNNVGILSSGFSGFSQFLPGLLILTLWLQAMKYVVDSYEPRGRLSIDYWLLTDQALTLTVKLLSL